ncbi:MAG TPA: hypothetical protein VEU55_05140 [Gemmatimonadales bacterium]|nr:hypothetical protein [Gemmatimonadales bacterium]
MHAKRLGTAGIAAALVGVVLGCGGGHAIFNVDLYSFIKGTSADTVPYLVPPNTSGAISLSSAPQKINMLGAGSSLVDSVVIFGTADLHNTTLLGSATVGLQVLMGDSAGILTNPDTALTLTPKVVFGDSTFADTVRGRLRPGVDTLFTKTAVWIRVAVQGSNTSLTQPDSGHLVLTSALLTVVLAPKLF